VDVVEVINASDNESDKMETSRNSNSTQSDLCVSYGPGKCDEMLNLKGFNLKLETKGIEEPTTREVKTSARQK
jgi:hypothetical protein